jgi:hypothetical protein
MNAHTRAACSPCWALAVVAWLAVAVASAYGLVLAIVHIIEAMS